VAERRNDALAYHLRHDVFCSYLHHTRFLAMSRGKDCTEIHVMGQDHVIVLGGAIISESGSLPLPTSDQ